MNWNQFKRKAEREERRVEIHVTEIETQQEGKSSKQILEGSLGCQHPIYGCCVAQSSHVVTPNRRVSVWVHPALLHEDTTTSEVTIHHHDTGHNDDWRVQSWEFPELQRVVHVLNAYLWTHFTYCLMTYLRHFPFRSFVDDLIQSKFQ